MDDGIKGMIIAGVVTTASIAFWIFQNKSRANPKNDLHPTDGDPRAQPVLAALKQGNVFPFHQLLQSCGQDWDTLGYYLDELVGHAPRPMLDAMCSSQPSPLAFLMRGAHGIEWAWEARGRGLSKNVSDESWQLFEQRLKWAEQDLLLAAQGNPADPTPWALLVRVAMATDAPPEVAWQHFQQATARQADNYRAHVGMRTNLSARWGGSHEQMLDFARRRAAEAPPGSDLPMLLFAAHLDVWSHIHSIDENPAGALSYIYQPQVRQELDMAYARSLGGPARPRATTILHRNNAAMVFHLWRDMQRLRMELDRIGPQGFSEYPWVYLRSSEGSTKDVVTMARASVGLR